MAIGLATAIIGSAVVGGVAANVASNRSSSAIEGASNLSTEEQRRQYDQTRADYAPWRAAGESALGRLDRASTGDMSDFQQSPGYNFRLQQGEQGINNIFGAGGSKYGGNALKALTEYNQNFASNEFGNWWNRQSGMAGVGQAATNATAGAGMNAANNISNNLMNAGNARASGYQQAGMNINNNIQSGIGNWLYYQGLQGQGPGSPGWTGTDWIPRRNVPGGP